MARGFRELTVSSPAEAVALQRNLAAQVRLSPLPPPRKGLLIAGADCSYEKRAVAGFAAVVVCRWPDLEVVDVGRGFRKVSFPYVPGLLSFRELPLLTAAWEDLSERPEIVFVDGQGIAHPRRIGLASHAGLAWNCPTVGCAKSVLVGKYRMPGEKRGCRTVLKHKGERIGTVVRTRSGVKSVIVSPGHASDFESAVRWVLRLAPKYRIPEVIRLAHQEVNRMRRERTLPQPLPKWEGRKNPSNDPSRVGGERNPSPILREVRWG
jgi:deoxyribonuclease V